MPEARACTSDEPCPVVNLSVSVVMSVFNGARYLERSVRSILRQEGVELELIIINDGSKDESSNILDRLVAEDDRIRVLDQENTGLTRSLIRGCQLARGRYIARQDCDDYSLPGRLALQQQVLDEQADVAFVSSWSEVIGPADELLLTHTRPVNSNAATELLVRKRVGPPGHGSVMFRKSVFNDVGGYREIFRFAQDSDLWLRMAMVGKLAYVPQVLYRYRIDGQSISGRNDALKEQYRRLVYRLHIARLDGADEEAIIAETELPPVNANYRSSESATLYFIARCLVNQRDKRALGYLSESLQLNASNLRAWCLLPITVALVVLGPLIRQGR